MMLRASYISSWAEHYRLIISRLFVVLVVLVLLFSGEAWPENGALSALARVLGFVLTVAACVGRIWSALYISGLKNVELVTDGPYSIVRNPLYFFSFLGAVGLGLFSENLWVLFLLSGAFVLYYPFVVFAEEQKLSDLHGERYSLYRDRTPAFLPRVSQFHEPEQYTVNARKFRRDMIEASSFLFFLVLLSVIRELHRLQILPVLF